MSSAIRKQFDVPVFFVQTDLQSNTDAQIKETVTPQLRLPLHGIDDHAITSFNTITPHNLEQFSIFLREFVTMNLVPWMEKCVVDWNESVSFALHLPASSINLCI